MIRHEIVQREEYSVGSEPPHGQVLLFEQYSLWRRTWMWVVLLSLLVTGLVAYLYFVVIPVEYAGTVRAVPPNKSSTPLDNLLGGISSSLKDFGVSKLLGGATTESGYPRSVILTSQPLMDSLIAHYDLFTVYEIPRDRRDLVYKTLTGNLEVVLEEQGPVSVTVYDVDPKRAAAMANDVIAFTNQIALRLSREETEQISAYIEGLLREKRAEQRGVEEQLRAFYRDNRLFDPETQAPVISQALIDAETEAAVQRRLADYFRNTLGPEDPKTKQAEELARQAETERRRVAGGMSGVGPSSDRLPDAAVEFGRLRLAYESNAKFVAIVEPLLEQSRYDELRSIRVLNVLDPARPPVEKARPKRSVLLASAFVGTWIVSYLVIALASYWRSFKRRWRAYQALERPAPAMNGTARVVSRPEE